MPSVINAAITVGMKNLLIHSSFLPGIVLGIYTSFPVAGTPIIFSELNRRPGLHFSGQAAGFEKRRSPLIRGRSVLLTIPAALKFRSRCDTLRGRRPPRDLIPCVASSCNIENVEQVENSIEPKFNFHADLHVYRTAILRGELKAPLLHSFNRSGIQSESQAVNHPNVAGRPWSSTISPSTQVPCVFALRASSVYRGSGVEIA